MEKKKDGDLWRLLTYVLAASLLCDNSAILQSKAEDADVSFGLVNFMKALHRNGNLGPSNWNSTPDPCNWEGITCKTTARKVSHVVLENMGLDGKIDAEMLCTHVKTIRVLSLKNNVLEGNIPDEISNCRRLTHLYLAGNQLSGTIPESLPSLNDLRVADLSRNILTGQLPVSLEGLLTLLVHDNQLIGELPPLDGSNIRKFNVSNNGFTGRIPRNIGIRFKDISIYAGNPGLCGSPLPACPAASPVRSPPPSVRQSSVPGIISKWTGYVAAFVGIAFALVFIFFYRRKYCLVMTGTPTDQNNINNNTTTTDNNNSSKTGSLTEGETNNASDYAVSASESKSASSSSLIFLDEGRKAVKFEDLLRSSAELIGKSSFGSLYRVLMEDGTALAVKRVTESAISRHEFERRMAIIGRLKHPNVLPLLAYYCSREDKLLVYEFQRNGSISSLLHGRFPDRKLDWHTRLAVAGGVAGGLAYVHRELESQNIPHGNLKSSNVLLDDNYQPRITECGLSFLQDDRGTTWSGYRAPECQQSRRRITQKADVYSFGVLLLELLTGKMVESGGLDLPKWVHSVVREEWTVEVLDRSMLDESASEERMVSLLQIAVSCVSHSPDNRPEMIQVARRIDRLRNDEERSLERNFASPSTYNSDADTTTPIVGN